MTREQFNEMYWLAQPPAVRKLKEMPALEQARQEAAVKLAQEGYQICVMIGAFGFDPYGTMLGYQGNGFKWVPALLQNLTVAQYPLNPWELSQDTPMPKGAIKISLEAADYPPFDPPSVPAPPPSFNPVGVNLYGNVFASSYGDTFADGSAFADSRGKFVKRSMQTMFGTRAWWEKVA